MIIIPLDVNTEHTGLFPELGFFGCLTKILLTIPAICEFNYVYIKPSMLFEMIGIEPINTLV